MRIELETNEPRLGHKLRCYFCWRRFPEGVASANAFSDDGQMFCGHVCRTCVARGEEWLERRLEWDARFSREEAEEAAELAREGISEVPTPEEYRLFERIAALDFSEARN